jgi:hypothetical protein
MWVAGALLEGAVVLLIAAGVNGWRRWGLLSLLMAISFVSVFGGMVQQMETRDTRTAGHANLIAQTEQRIASLGAEIFVLDQRILEMPTSWRTKRTEAKTLQARIGAETDGLRAEVARLQAEITASKLEKGPLYALADRIKMTGETMALLFAAAVALALGPAGALLLADGVAHIRATQKKREERALEIQELKEEQARAAEERIREEEQATKTPATPDGLRERFQTQIVRHGWTQKAAAKALGMSTSTISRWVRGKVEIPAWAVAQLEEMPVRPTVRTLRAVA